MTSLAAFKDKPLKKCHTDKREMIDDIHHKIIENISDEKKIEYYLENGVLLDEYYSGENKCKKNINNTSSILNYFKTSNIKDDSQDNDNSNDDNNIINNYMCNIDDNFINNKYKNIFINF